MKKIKASSATAKPIGILFTEEIYENPHLNLPDSSLRKVTVPAEKPL